MYIAALLLTGAAVLVLVYGTRTTKQEEETLPYEGTAPALYDSALTGDNPDTSDVQGTYKAPEQHDDVLADKPPKDAKLWGKTDKYWFGNSMNPFSQLGHAIQQGILQEGLSRAIDANQEGYLTVGDSLPTNFTGGHFTDVHFGGETFTRQEANDYLAASSAGQDVGDTRLGKAVAVWEKQEVERQEIDMMQAVATAVVMGQDLPAIPKQFHTFSTFDDQEAKKAYLKARRKWVETFQQGILAEGGTLPGVYQGRHLVPATHEEARPSTPPPQPDLSMFEGKAKPGSTKPTAQGGGTGRDVNDHFSHTGSLPETQPMDRDGGH